jgi:predicted MFS family arabinose efflux permease
LISTHKGISIVPFFILYFSLNSLVLYGVDLFLEHYSADTQTGNIRGIYLTISNIGWVIAPLLSAKLQNNFGFSAIYLVASIAVLFTMIIIFVGQRGFIDKAYTKSSLIDGLRVLKENKNIRILTILNFILQSFFVVMVIYSPVYLTSIIGFSWQNLGILLSIMLSAFVIFPYPAGRLADTRIGEKWLICISLFIMSTATFIFAKLGAASLFSYALVLFLTRMGASVLETMCDSAFFKQVSDSDSAVISVYRNMMPFAYTIGPLLAGAIFAISSYQTLFTILGMLVLVSIIIAMKLRIVKN